MFLSLIFKNKKSNDLSNGTLSENNRIQSNSLTLVIWRMRKVIVDVTHSSQSLSQQLKRWQSLKWRVTTLHRGNSTDGTQFLCTKKFLKKKLNWDKAKHIHVDIKMPSNCWLGIFFSCHNSNSLLSLLVWELQLQLQHYFPFNLIFSIFNWLPSSPLYTRLNYKFNLWNLLG